jgi:hypothetical protein
MNTKNLKRLVLLFFIILSLISFILIGYYYTKKDQSAVDSDAATHGRGDGNCSDGTAYGQCSKTKPKYCGTDAPPVNTLVDRCSKCGCPAGYTCQPDNTCKTNLPKCTDGTVLNQCSTTKPKVCVKDGESLKLENNCSKCGCPVGKECVNNGTCETTTKKCSDNTVYGKCSTTKPKFCNSKGVLQNKCGTCECPSGQTCEDDGTCKKTTGVVCGPMDTNGDGKLTLIDLANFVKVYRKTCKDTAPTTGCKGKDTNGDKKITLPDLSNFVKKYGKKSCK